MVPVVLIVAAALAVMLFSRGAPDTPVTTPEAASAIPAPSDTPPLPRDSLRGAPDSATGGRTPRDTTPLRPPIGDPAALPRPDVTIPRDAASPEAP